MAGPSHPTAAPPTQPFTILPGDLLQLKECATPQRPLSGQAPDPTKSVGQEAQLHAYNPSPAWGLLLPGWSVALHPHVPAAPESAQVHRTDTQSQLATAGKWVWSFTVREKQGAVCFAASSGLDPSPPLLVPTTAM